MAELWRREGGRAGLGSGSCPTPLPGTRGALLVLELLGWRIVGPDAALLARLVQPAAPQRARPVLRCRCLALNCCCLVPVQSQHPLCVRGRAPFAAED